MTGLEEAGSKEEGGVTRLEETGPGREGGDGIGGSKIRRGRG